MSENDAKQDALFVNLILVFKSAAMQQMGKLINPITGEVERNLDQARFSIDTLDMLKTRTRGNLPADVERLLDSTLLELRMNFVEEAAADAKAQKEAEAKADGEKKAGQEDGPSEGRKASGEEDPGRRPEPEDTSPTSGEPRAAAEPGPAGEGGGGLAAERDLSAGHDPDTVSSTKAGEADSRQMPPSGQRKGRKLRTEKPGRSKSRSGISRKKG